jgi:predicted aspartyl protease
MTRSRLPGYAAAALLSILVTTMAARQEPDFAAFYQNHQWFELRDAATQATIPPFYRAALACAFHDVSRCETAVRSALADQPASAQAYELHEQLSQFYFRAGRYRLALAEVESMLAIRPEAADVGNAEPLLRVLSRTEDQQTTAYAPSTLAVHISNENFPVPIRINGKACQYFLDTGANVSVIAESEARRLGLRIEEVSTRIRNTPGDAIAIRAASATEVVVGGVRLAHVAFLVFKDDQEPFTDLKPNHRGAIGLPVLLALGSLSWGVDNRLQIGATAPRGAEPNLGFDGALPIVRLSIEGKPLAFNLDTGAEETMLWPPFAREFPVLIERLGQRSTTNVSGVGSSQDVDSIDLRTITLVLGGRSVTLAPAPVLLKATTSDTHRRFGNLGLDALNQARRTTIDFRTMTLTLEGVR